VYGFRTWAPRPTLAVLGAVMATTGAAIGVDVARGTESVAELTEGPAHGGDVPGHGVARPAQAHRGAGVAPVRRGERPAPHHQRRFLQDASHQLRTPITIALGHAELLAGGLAGRQEGHDIEVVLGELNRLRRIAERLLVIAAAEGPEFLSPSRSSWTASPWRSCAGGGPPPIAAGSSAGLDKVTVQADRERLGLAVDALLENAVRHTASGTSSSSPWWQWATGCRFA
jgi:signal transduction histidine kinase